MQQELAEPSSDLHSLTFAVIGESVFNDRCVIFVDNIGLGITSGKDDIAMDCNPRTDKCRCKHVLVVHYGRVDMAECCIRCNLACGVVLFRVDNIRSLWAGEVARYLSLCLRVGHQDEFRCGNLLVFLAPNFEGRPSYGVGSHRRYWRGWYRSSHHCIGWVGFPVGVCIGLVGCLFFIFLFLVFLALGSDCRRCFEGVLDIALVGKNLLL